MKRIHIIATLMVAFMLSFGTASGATIVATSTESTSVNSSTALSGVNFNSFSSRFIGGGDFASVVEFRGVVPAGQTAESVTFVFTLVPGDFVPPTESEIVIVALDPVPLDVETVTFNTLPTQSVVAATVLFDGIDEYTVTVANPNVVMGEIAFLVDSLTPDDPDNDDIEISFQGATFEVVPEPSTSLLGFIGALLLLRRRRA